MHYIMYLLKSDRQKAQIQHSRAHGLGKAWIKISQANSFSNRMHKVHTDGGERIMYSESSIFIKLSPLKGQCVRKQSFAN